MVLPHVGEPLLEHSGDRAVSDGPPSDGPPPAALHDTLQLAACRSSSQLPAEDPFPLLVVARLKITDNHTSYSQ